jgi:hypothetical protein
VSNALHVAKVVQEVFVAKVAVISVAPAVMVADVTTVINNLRVTGLR